MKRCSTASTRPPRNGPIRRYCMPLSSASSTCEKPACVRNRIRNRSRVRIDCPLPHGSFESFYGNRLRGFLRQGHHLRFPAGGGKEHSEEEHPVSRAMARGRRAGRGRPPSIGVFRGRARRRHRRQDRRRYQLVLAELKNVETTGVGKSADAARKSACATSQQSQFAFEEI